MVKVGSCSRESIPIIFALSVLCMLLPGQVQGDTLEVGSRRQVTDIGAYHPRWSPDGEQIAMTTGDWPALEIHVVASEGGATTAVVTDRPGDLSLCWHPDGTRISFDAYNENERLDIYSVWLSTSGVVRNTTETAFGPDWSPDGRRLAFASGRDGGSNIYSTAADGSDLRRHTWEAGDHFYQQWSPDGGRLAYCSHRLGNTDIWIVDVVTGEETRFTDSPAEETRPAWSPDGRWLAFDSLRNGVHHVYARPLEGGRDVCLTCDHPDGGMADWSPDGRSVAYVTGGDIWVAEVAFIPAARAAPRRATGRSSRR